MTQWVGLYPNPSPCLTTMTTRFSRLDLLALLLLIVFAVIVFKVFVSPSRSDTDNPYAEPYVENPL